MLPVTRHKVQTSCGLSNAENIDSIIVQWPRSGMSQKISTLDVNQKIRIIEDSSTVEIDTMVNEIDTTLNYSFLSNPSIEIHPNPVIDHFYIFVKGQDSAKLHYSIKSINGEEMQTGKYQHGQNLNISHFGTGIYIIELRKNGIFHSSKKIVKL